MNHYVYEITNLVNGKKYIGKRSCKCPIENDRYMGSGYALKKAFDKYGKEKFSKTILAICDTSDDAYLVESQYITLTNAVSSSDYYNIAGGGKGTGVGKNSANYGRKHSELTKIKMSKASKGRKLSKAQKLKISERSSKKIILLNTKEVFNSILSASIKYKLDYSSISKNCNNKSYYSGVINGEPLVWMDYNEYLNSSSYEIDRRIQKGNEGYNKIKIILLNNGEIFDSILDASIKYNIDNRSISRCCIGKFAYAGLIDGEPAVWVFYDKYKMISDSEINYKLSIAKERLLHGCNFGKPMDDSIKKKISDSLKGEKNHFYGKTHSEESRKKISEARSKYKGVNHPWYGRKHSEQTKTKISKANSKKVILLNENKIFNSIIEAGEYVGLKYEETISRCCKGKLMSAGKVNGEKAVWMYYEDYLKTIGK